jgi:hypothetical protein
MKKFVLNLTVFLPHTETNQELVETRGNLVKTVDELSVKLNGNFFKITN